MSDSMSHTASKLLEAAQLGVYIGKQEELVYFPLCYHDRIACYRAYAIGVRSVMKWLYEVES
jgi:hypothetical protein